jgi:M6 family metalloprotease-like protein
VKLNLKVFHCIVATVFLAGLALCSAQPVYSQTEGDQASLSGWFNIIWGDDANGTSSGEPIYQLAEANGRTTRLLLNESLAQSLGGVLSLNGKAVSLEGVWAAANSIQGTSTALRVTSIALNLASGTEAQDGSDLPAVTGSKPWVTIMCKFSGIATEPKNLAFFQGMYANTEPGLDHYWRQQSYDTANVAGSNAYGWFNLPHAEIYYNPTDTEQGTNLSLLATECIAAADASVNFSLYTGINMMFNSDFDNGWAWGGSRTMTLDGVTKTWSTTWEPPWSYASISVIAHEMGHGFGLPHSSGNYGATYDNAWDVMSQDRYNCAAATDPTYGCEPQHTISYHKDRLGWIPAGQKYTAGSGSNVNLTLERLALPSTANYKMVQIPIGGSATHFYTVEARRLNGYDIKLAGNAVIIHEVDTTRTRPAYVIDTDGNGITSDAGAMFIAGETFTDAANSISVNVTAATASGFTVNVRNHATSLTGYLAGSFPGAGLYTYNFTSGTWTQISPFIPENFVYAGTTLYADFGVNGLYRWNGVTWTLLATANLENILISGSTLYGDFGASGLYSYNGATWTQIATTNPENMVAYSAKLYVDFGASGIWMWNGSVWAQVTPSNPENMIMANSTFVGDFGASGIYFTNNDGASWIYSTPSNPGDMVWATPYLIGDFGASGVWRTSGAGTVWTQVAATNPENLVIGGTTLYGDFGASGIWQYSGTGMVWTSVATGNPENMLTKGSVLIGDFGSSGIYKYEGASWNQLATANPIKMALSN